MNQPLKLLGDRIIARLITPDMSAGGILLPESAGNTAEHRLAEVLPLVDWVGIDVKAGWPGYDANTCITDSARHARASAELVLASGVAHEFRTTVHPNLHTEQDILTLAQSLSAMGVQNYALQVFRGTGCADMGLQSQATAGYPGTELLARVSALFAGFTFRRE